MLESRGGAQRNRRFKENLLERINRNRLSMEYRGDGDAAVEDRGGFPNYGLNRKLDIDRQRTKVIQNNKRKEEHRAGTLRQSGREAGHRTEMEPMMQMGYEVKGAITARATTATLPRKSAGSKAVASSGAAEEGRRGGWGSQPQSRTGSSRKLVRSRSASALASTDGTTRNLRRDPETNAQIKFEVKANESETRLHRNSTFQWWDFSDTSLDNLDGTRIDNMTGKSMLKNVKSGGYNSGNKNPVNDDFSAARGRGVTCWNCHVDLRGPLSSSRCV